MRQAVKIVNTMIFFIEYLLKLIVNKYQFWYFGLILIPTTIIVCQVFFYINFPDIIALLIGYNSAQTSKDNLIDKPCTNLLIIIVRAEVIFS